MMAKATANVEALPKVLEVLNLIVTTIDTPAKKSKKKFKFDVYSYAAAEMHECSNGMKFYNPWDHAEFHDPCVHVCNEMEMIREYNLDFLRNIIYRFR